jgi:hypothetical protein
MALQIWLVALTDGTDEIYNLSDYSFDPKEGESAGDAMARMFAEDFAENWDDDSFDYGDDLTPQQHHLQWMENRFWLPCLFDPTEAVEKQNRCDVHGGNKFIFEETYFFSLENVIPVLQALMDATKP